MQQKGASEMQSICLLVCFCKWLIYT